MRFCSNFPMAPPPPPLDPRAPAAPGPQNHRLPPTRSASLTHSGGLRILRREYPMRHSEEGAGMKAHGLRAHLLAILFSGLAVGSLGLLEPLLRFWGSFHLIGLAWPSLLLLYLGAGIAVAIAGGVPVAIGLAVRAARWRTVSIAAYYVAATLAVAAVLIAAPLLRRESIGLRMPISYGVLFPVLIVLAAALVVKVTPHVLTPLLGVLIGRRGGLVSPSRLAVLLIVVGLLIPLTIVKEVSARHTPGGRVRSELRTRPGDQAVQNLLFLTIDALRADHLGLYGYHRPTSPNIDALGAQSLVFDHCISQGNSTELSMGAVFTSLYPSMHSVKRYGHIASALPHEVETLAEHLRDAGLSTSGLMNNPFIKREWGLSQGFMHLDEFHVGCEELLPMTYLLKVGLRRTFERIPQTRSIPRASVMAEEGIAQLRELADRPFYLHVHFMDVHHPYIPPKSYQEMFTSPGAARTEAVEFWRRGWRLFNEIPADPQAIGTAEVRRIIDLYDGCIRYADEQIARLLAELEALGIADRTLVILTADHGDEFLEHGDIFHKSPFLYDELIHVPLIVRHPAFPEPLRIPQIVRHIDLMPTLLEVFDLPPSPAAQGRSLLPLFDASGPWLPVAAYSESYQFMGVRTRGHKLMIDRTADGAAYCFDLREDPGERVNIYGQAGPCDSLEVELNKFLLKISVPPAGRPGRELDERTQEQLRSIGYM
ncbi:MAG: sulfatase-like hydrolase/transferase [Candidatus Eisenbacteria bacterium]|nr:sulfatase-like hydrolase/transferase [Candidatus Eisenbacteria bacterium]